MEGPTKIACNNTYFLKEIRVAKRNYTEKLKNRFSENNPVSV